jgi:cytochrome b pre-mRNA-processing protein 3
MIFKAKTHNHNLYNTLLFLSRNVFFYKKVNLLDTFETRIYLMFMHFALMMIISKRKGQKFDQKTYDKFFHNIENNLRELGFGDVSVNKKMKEFNKILYDILLKIELNKDQKLFKINKNLINKYFNTLNDIKSVEYLAFESYLLSFYHFCFELSLENMVRDAIKFKN